MPLLNNHPASPRQVSQFSIKNTDPYRSYYVQALITQLLTQHWKYSGYVEWLQGLRSAYTIRRDALIDALGKHFDLQEQYDENDLSSYYPLVGSVKTFVGRSRKTKGVEKNKILFSFVAPTSGMFLWVSQRVHGIVNVKGG